MNRSPGSSGRRMRRWTIGRCAACSPHCGDDRHSAWRAVGPTCANTQGAIIPDDLLAHVAPLGWEHIALTGDYVWANSNAAPDFRPLRDVPSAFLARAA